MRTWFELMGGFVEKVNTRLKEKRGFYELGQSIWESYGLQVYFQYPQMIVTKGGGILSVGLEYNVEVRKWDKKKTKYNVIYVGTPFYAISNDDVMGDEEVEICSNYFLEIFISLAQRAPEIAFLNKTKKGA